MQTALTYSFWNIIRRLGTTGSDEAKREYVQELIKDYGFPEPFPSSQHGKAGLTRNVTFRSQWSREAVDAWFFDFNPPAINASIERMAENEAADRLDDHCENLSFQRQAA